jgi:hypothetical protein
MVWSEWRLSAARFPLWAVALALYAISRLWSSALLLGWFGFAKSTGRRLGNVGAHADFWSYLTSWDGHFFTTIATMGYPATLPMMPDGHIDGSSWAFLPLYPALVKALAVATSMPIDIAAVVIALLAGGAATVTLARLLSLRIPRSGALWGTALFCFGPMSFLLQVGYSESLSAFLLFAGLVALVERRYLVLLAFGVAAAFTRPGALALAVAVAVHVIVRWRTEGFPRRQLVAAVVAGLGIAAAGLAWPVIVGAVTGIPDAYTQTELAWWSTSVGHVDFVPLTPWFVAARTSLGGWGIPAVLVVVGAAAWWFSRRSLRRVGPEILAYGASYALYVFAVFLPQQSLFRVLLLPLAPLAGDDAIAGSRRGRRILLVASLALQPVAVVALWSVSFP